MNTYLVTWNSEAGPQTIQLTGASIDDIKDMMAAKRIQGEAGSPGYRVVEQPARPSFQETLPGLGSATLVMAGAVVLTGIILRRLRRWLEA